LDLIVRFLWTRILILARSHAMVFEVDFIPDASERDW
jgi:hypothetical protein